MSKRKLRVAILFGGKSAEHEVSLQSAKNVIESIDKSKYDVVLIGIDKDGKWYLNEGSTFLLNGTTTRNPSLPKESDHPRPLRQATCPPHGSRLLRLRRSEVGQVGRREHGGRAQPLLEKEGRVNKELALIPGKPREQLVWSSSRKSVGRIDAVFPVLHGPFGEDGTVQGLLKLANIPFVGASVLGSAIGMDKDVTKRLLRDAGIPIPRFVAVEASHRKNVDFERARKVLGVPMFVKPANLGSSVGIHKVKHSADFQSAIDHAFAYDAKVLIEEFIEGREIECSVLGNDHPIASLPGEIIALHEFYSYRAKYLDEKGASLEIPAKLRPDTVKNIQSLAIKVFKTLSCEGMARVDFFLRPNGELLVNEINTIPGFTKISMYPKLWEASGISYTELIDRLIQLAIERFEREKNLKTSFFNNA